MIFAIGIDFKVIKCYGKNRKFARDFYIGAYKGCGFEKIFNSRRFYMKKRNIKKIILIALLVIFAALGIFMVLAPQIPVRENPNRKSLWKDETNDAYDVAYNVYGKLIFKNRSKALKQFKKDYAVTLEYLEQCGYGEFNTDFETLQRYETYSWQHTVEKGTENEELIKSQLGNVSSFLDVYYNGSYTYYFPFCKAVS